MADERADLMLGVANLVMDASLTFRFSLFAAAALFCFGYRLFLI
jgi:hypothetical protein